MTGLVRLPLEGGGSILIEAPPGLEGPVKAGRVSEAIHELPVTLQAALEPVAEMAQTVANQLRKASPAEVQVEFGVDLAVEAGAVITKTGASGHLKVRVTWRSGQRDQDRHGG
ncbi:CU044_2847 family protein [Streptomyces sp. RGM 3693]|uniref:CU044_2847 family protein n=1 Tax=Streptomyces sp. RGM 3693 TaxID=3413284 RepID=UPI003D2C7570